VRLAIPLQFDIVNRTYTVRYATPAELLTKKWRKTDGRHSPEGAEIILRKGMAPEYEDHTFLHELEHAIFEAIGRDKLSHDETLVDLHAGALHQFLKSKRGKLT
jgi:hypothetical protein